MDELINRQDLSNEIQRIYDEHYADANSQTVHDIFHAVLKRVDKAKVVDAESVRHGHWIVKQTSIGCEYTVCSSCQTDFKFKTNTGTLARLDMRGQNYCPNCGAKMDEVSE